MIIAITGHRPYQKDKKTDEWISKLAWEGLDPKSRILFNRLVDMYSAYYTRHSPDRVIMGGAMGADLAAGWAALQDNIPIDAYIPYKGHGEWKSFYKQVHDHVVSEAATVQYFAEEYSNKSYIIRDHAMVDACDVLLALWDKKEEGGTYQTVKYARSINKPMTNLWDSWILHRAVDK